MGDAIVELAEAVTTAEALKLASSLAIDGKLPKALAQLSAESVAAAPLSACFDALGAAALASVLRGFARSGEANRTDLRAVWSGTTFEGDGDHTTSALSHFIDEAHDDVFASTYSATPHSAFVKALWRAVGRGVRTTLLVDSEIKKGEIAAMLQKRLSGARFWTYSAADGTYAAQHSKVVIVDSHSAFVTSANLSDAAEERNLEAGVIIRDPEFASRMRQRFARLRESGGVREL